MAKRQAIAIGVSKAGHLPELPGALSGAREFAEWAKTAGFETTLITDENGPVTVAALRDAIRMMLDDDVERLLVYFAGHGTANASSDLWLLSGWEDDGNEVVNVALSFNHAKRQHIPKIAVFADACRSAVPQIAYLGGANIFPKVPAPAPRSPQWDMFLATRLSEAAQEAGGDPVGSYGIFTRQLMSALNAKEANAFEREDDGTEKVTSPSLANWLEDAVPFASGMIPGAVTQYPDISVAWRPPDNVYVSRVASEVLARVPSQGLTRGPNPRENTLSMIAKAQIARRRDVMQDIAEDLKAAASSAPPFVSFPSRTGLSVFGAEVVEIVGAAGARPQTIASESGFHVGFDGARPRSVALRLVDGRWAVTLAVPGYAGAITFENGMFVGLKYARLRGDALDVEGWRREAYLVAKLTAAVRHAGSALRLRDRAKLFERDVTHALIGRDRSPTSIVLAAYICERQGRLDEVREFLAEQDRLAVPITFDVPLLAGWPADDRFPANQDFVGVFPLMTAGWAYIDEDTPSNETLRPLRAHLAPGLWTTFDAEGGRKVANLFERGLL